MKLKAIIAAGGKGTRLRPLTFTANKHLLPIANKPLILYPLENIRTLGIKEVGVIVNESRKAIENILGDGSKLLILTNLNADSELPPNIYAVNLK